MEPIPDLPEIERRLLEFLDRVAAEGNTEIRPAPRVAWVLADDAVFYSYALRVRLPRPEDNRAGVAALAASFSARALGVEVSALGSVGGTLFATVFVPETADEAAARDISGLKIAVRQRALPILEVRSSLAWRILRLVGKPSTKLLAFMSKEKATRVLGPRAAGRGDPV